MKRKTTVGCVLVCIAALVGCGGGGSSSPSTVTTTTVPAPVRTLVGQGTFTLAQGGDVAGVPFTLGAAGTVDVSVDWTFRSNDIDIAILPGSCNSVQVLQGVCGTTTIVESTSITAKPETVSTRLNAGNFTLGIVSNPGSSAESGTFAIFVTR